MFIASLEARVSLACKADDVAAFQEIIDFESQAHSPNSESEEERWRNTPGNFGVDAALNMGFRRSFERRAYNVLRYCLKNGADHSCVVLWSDTPLEALEILLEYGWDINSASPHVLRALASSETKIRWCLDHGASVHTPDADILAGVAVAGTVDTFKLLLSLGAPIGPTVVHGAARSAAGNNHKGRDPEENRLKSWPMLRYVVTELKLDVNALDRQKNLTYPGTVLCHTRRCSGVDLEAVRFLLAAGADPTKENKFGMSALYWADPDMEWGRLILSWKPGTVEPLPALDPILANSIIKRSKQDSD